MSKKDIDMYAALICSILNVVACVSFYHMMLSNVPLAIEGTSTTITTITQE